MSDEGQYPVSIVGRQMQVTQPAGTDEGLSIGDLLRQVLAHKWLIAGCGVLGALLSSGYARFRPALYEATALVRIDPDRADSLAITDRPSPSPADPSETLHTEIAIVKSDQVAIRVLNALTADDFLKFTGTRRTGNALLEDGERLSDQQQGWVDKLERSLTVKQVDGTQLISVTVQYHDPKMVTTLDNEVVNAYLVQTFEDRAHSAAQLRTWLSSQMDELRSHVEESQAKLADFEKANNVVDTAGASNTIADRLHFLSDKLSALQSDRIGKEAEMRAAIAGSSAELGAMFPNPKLNTLEAAQGTLYGQYAQLSSKFGQNYLPLSELTKQMAGIDREIDGEVDAARERLKTDYLAAKRAQDMLQEEYDNEMRLAYDFNRNQAEYSVLQGDVTASKEMYDALRRKLQQATVDTEIGGLNTMLVQGARTPLKPAGPRSLYLTLGGLIVGLFAGAAAGFVGDLTSDRVGGTQQLERDLGTPVLARFGILPHSPESSRSTLFRTALRPPLVLDAPQSKAAEAMRLLRNSVILRDGRLLMVASCRAGEGAHHVALNVSVLLAQSGNRVLLVDANFSEPTLESDFGVHHPFGLRDFLRNKFLVPKPSRLLPSLSDLFVVPAGNNDSESSDLLTSTAFRSLLLKWRDDFDYVVLASSPLLSDSAGFVLASWVDGTIVVAQNGCSRVSELKDIRETLRRNKAALMGFVLTDLPGRREAKRNSAFNKEAHFDYNKLSKQAQIAD